MKNISILLYTFLAILYYNFIKGVKVSDSRKTLNIIIIINNLYKRILFLRYEYCFMNANANWKSNHSFNLITTRSWNCSS